MMSEAFKHLDDNNKKLMEALIMQNMDKVGDLVHVTMDTWTIV